jgi:hypothetical protein
MIDAGHKRAPSRLAEERRERAMILSRLALLENR